MMRLSLLVALLTMPAALAAQGLPIDSELEPEAVSQPTPQLAPNAEAIEIAAPRPRAVRYSQPKIRYPDAPPPPVLLAASAGGAH